MEGLDIRGECIPGYKINMAVAASVFNRAPKKDRGAVSMLFIDMCCTEEMRFTRRTASLTLES